MLTKKEMARVMRISVREFERLLSSGEVPPGVSYMGGRHRWPAFVAYYFVFGELFRRWTDGGGDEKQASPNPAKPRQTPPNPTK